MTSIPTPSSEATPQQKVVNFLEKKGKLELWAGTIAAKGLAFGQRQQELNQSAEDAFVRRKLWGQTDARSEADMSGHTILGDIIVPSQPQQASGSLGKVLAGAALGASLLGIPGAGLAGFLLSRMQPQPQPQNQQEPQEQESESVNLGLLRIDDLKQ